LFVSRAWQLNEIGQPALAQEDAETALTLDKKSAGALAELSYALMKLGQPNEALAKIKLATDLDPQLAIALANIAAKLKWCVARPYRD